MTTMQYLFLFTFLILSCSDESKKTLDPHISPDAITKKNDSFERMPFISEVKLLGKDSKSLALIGVHLKPTAAVQEANLLDNLYLEVSKESGLPDALILGDMNLSCSYASNAELEALDMRKDTAFKWLINDSADTNVADTNCAYDRIIAIGNGLSGISEGEVDGRTIEHSDHKPVWTSINGIRIGAFNTKIFGKNKVDNPNALKELVEIVCYGDLILLQEIVTTETDPVDTLLARVRQECGNSFEMNLSDRTGSTSYMERFAYFYRSEKVEMIKAKLLSTSITDTNKNTKPNPPDGPTQNPTQTECGINPYKTPGGYCYATKDGTKKRVANSCCL